MTRTRRAAPSSISRPTHRSISIVAGGILSAVVFCVPVVCAAATPVRIAVAPFVGLQLGLGVAEAIVSELRKRPLDRLIAPGAFVAEARFDPSAEEIRSWAYNAAVEVVVVGRIFETTPSEKKRPGEHRIEIVLRSGHSGAELARHNALVANPKRLQAAARQLASAILEDLDYAEPTELTESDVESPTALHAVGFASPRSPGSPSGAAAAGEGGGRGLEASFDGAGFDTGAPIEIKADEAEIINRDTGRELVFQHNVLVRQANVTLRSDHLAASYRKGESEPEKLVARGKVLVDQGDRRAKCDRVVYMRAAQELTCSGHAELVQGCDIVRGESIQFDLRDNRARVEGAASIVILPEGDTPVSCGSVRGVM
jgi:lipopolysaccharide transport protein LptA